MLDTPEASGKYKSTAILQASRRLDKVVPTPAAAVLPGYTDMGPRGTLWHTAPGAALVTQPQTVTQISVRPPRQCGFAMPEFRPVLGLGSPHP